MSECVKIAVCGRLPLAFGLSRVDVRAAARHFAARSSSRIGGAPWLWVTVNLVDDAQSDEIHRAVMGMPGATDVVTQAYESIPPEPPGICGELFVNTDQALRVAPKRRGWSVAKELLLYVAHGMDHLSGADDLDEAGFRAMRRRELAWVREVCP